MSFEFDTTDTFFMPHFHYFRYLRNKGGKYKFLGNHVIILSQYRERLVQFTEHLRLFLHFYLNSSKIEIYLDIHYRLDVKLVFMMTRDFSLRFISMAFIEEIIYSFLFLFVSANYF